jgi:hypothetical protein
MTWNYRVFKTTEDGVESFDIHEVYYDKSGKPRSFTENPCRPYGHSVEELKADLIYMLEAVNLPVLTISDYELSTDKRRL